MIFDWDGTLYNSIELIKNSLQYSFQKMRLPIPSDEQARYVVGTGARESMQYLGVNLSDRQLTKLSIHYRQRYLELEPVMCMCY